MSCTLCACLFASSYHSGVVVHTPMHCWTCSKIPSSQRPKIPSRPRHMGVRCVGRCHLHSFPVFTSVIDSCIPIFTKPLFHCFPPVLIPSSHTSLSSYCPLSIYLSRFLPHTTVQMPHFPHISFHSCSPQVQPYTIHFKMFYFYWWIFWTCLKSLTFSSVV